MIAKLILRVALGVFGTSVLAQTPASAAQAGAKATYIVTLRDAPLVDAALQRVQRQAAAVPGSRATTQSIRQALNASESALYLRQLDSARDGVLALARTAISRPLTPTQVYRHALNGMAVELTRVEADRIAQLPGVASVQPERISRTHTDAGPQWIGADKLWSGQVDGVAATRGEGIVVGVIDSGINPAHPSFASLGGDGYAHANPRGKVYGLCASGKATCTDKLIGVYDFTDEGSNGVDTTGHGSHVSGIVAGNVYSTTLHGRTVDLPRNVSGVAPHANLIMYKACKVDKAGTSPGGTCPGSSLLSAIDQAVADQVDVINFSIGGDASDPYAELRANNNDSAAMFRARASGIVIAVSAGNDGPSPHTVGDPANAPWVIGVASASHNRRFANLLVNLNGVANAPADIAGAGFTSGYGPATIVYAGDFGSALCGTGASQSTPDGTSNPFPAGTFHGEIVICDRGTYGRVEKGYNLKLAGAGGYILANAASNGESTISDDHWLPAVHIGYAEGVKLKAWVAQAGAHNGTISGVTAVLDASFGDIIDSFSSRGPTGFTGGLLKPDITAPGSNILSAAMTGSGLAFLSGTSMASPHVAGALALVRAAHRDWSAAQVESALLGTALAGSLRKEDAATPATPLDGGSGRAQPATAAQAGLYLPLTSDDIRASDPTRGGDPRNLNRIGIEDEHCFQQCSFTRTVADLSGGGTWQVSVAGPSGANISVSPNQFTLAAGASQPLAIAAEVSDPHLVGTWVAARIVLHKTAGGRSAADTALQMDVYSDPGAQPAFAEINATAPGGHTDLTVSGLAALPRASYSVTSLATPTATQMTLPVDTSPSTPYTLPGTGKQVVVYPHFVSTFPANPDGTTGQHGRVQFVEASTADAPGVTLYVGIDSDGDGAPSQSEQVCQSTTSAGGAPARCIVDLRNTSAAVWALVQVNSGTSGTSYSITLNGAQPYASTPRNGAGNNGGQVVTGPGIVPALASFPLRMSWRLGYPNRYFGAILVDGAAGLDGQTAVLPFAITRQPGGNDVVEPYAIAFSSKDIVPPVQSGGFSGPIEVGETLSHMFIDIPQGVTSLGLSPGETDAFAQGALKLYVARADFPAAGASATPAAAPPESAAIDARSVIGPPAGRTSYSVPVSAGRWYLVMSNSGNTRTTYSIGYTLTYAGAAGAKIAPGAYYNPLRSGHGIFISQASGQQAADWYTFLEDGTPVWYQAQGAAPNPANAAWTAPMYRVNWDGAKVNARTVVGDLTLTPVSDSDLLFSWHLDAQAGSERFTRIGAGACPNLNGVAVNLSGAWYAPTQSGYGMDIITTPDLQAGAFYFYDTLGVARWGFASTAPFAPTSTLSVTQNKGFCPLCDYVKVTTQPLGTLYTAYTDASSGTYATRFTLQAPLSGAWNIDAPMMRLTGSPTCPP